MLQFSPPEQQSIFDHFKIGALTKFISVGSHHLPSWYINTLGSSGSGSGNNNAEKKFSVHKERTNAYETDLSRYDIYVPILYQTDQKPIATSL